MLAILEDSLRNLEQHRELIRVGWKGASDQARHANGSACLFPLPAPSECRHRGLARGLVAVDRRAVFVVAVGERP